MPSDAGTVYIKHEASEETEKAERGFLSESKPSKLDEMAERAGMVIFEAQSLAPFLSKAKDKITITPNRITITKGSWLMSEEYPMGIENITQARIYRQLLFASLEIDTFGIAKPDPIRYMRIKEARLARRYILALIECKKANIDLTDLELPELREKLKNIGMVRYSTEKVDYHDI